MWNAQSQILCTDLNLENGYQYLVQTLHFIHEYIFKTSEFSRTHLPGI